MRTRADLIPRELRLPLLLAVLTASIYVFLWILPEDTPLFRLLTEPFRPSTARLHAEYIRGLRMKDPRLGTVMFVPRPGRTGQRTMVVFVGRCSPCALEKLTELDHLSRTNAALNVVVVSQAEAADIRAFWKEYHLQVPTVADPDQHLSNQYNAAWKPRAYLLDETGVLRWVQPDTALDLPGVVRIARAGVIR